MTEVYDGLDLDSAAAIRKPSSMRLRQTGEYTGRQVRSEMRRSVPWIVAAVAGLSGCLLSFSQSANAPAVPRAVPNSAPGIVSVSPSTIGRGDSQAEPQTNS